MPFTKKELLELRKADKLIDKTFCITAEERQLCNELDREAKDVRKKGTYTPKVAAYQKACREADPEKFKIRKQTWYQKNKERILSEDKDYRKMHRRELQDRQNEKRRANKDHYNQKQREYRQRKKAELCADRISEGTDPSVCCP